MGLATDGTYQLPAHLDIVDRLLVEVATRIVLEADPEERGHGPRLMIFMPPRHGKSMTATEKNVAWFLGLFPTLRVVIASYAQDLALGWSRRARDLLHDRGPDLFGVDIKQDSKSASYWETTFGGSLTAVGVGSGLTGKGANLLIIDDPLKDNEQAQSEVIRDKQWDWWQTTARTRLQKGAGVILIMTRWHEDDLAGRLLKQMADGHGDHWDVVSLPAIAEDDGCTATYEGGKLDLGADPLDRAPGEALWPAMFDAPVLEQTRRATDPYWFAGMYQQRPAPDEGGIFKRADFRYWRGYDAVLNGGRSLILTTDSGEVGIDLDHCFTFQTIDSAASEKESADYTVIATWAVDSEGRMILLHRERVHLEVDAQPGLIIGQYAQWQPGFVGMEVVAAHAARGVYKELTKAGLPMRKLIADKEKRARAVPVSQRIREHLVFWPADAPWREEWESEIGSFPNSAHDDQVDVLAYAGRELPKIQVGPAPRDPDPQPRIAPSLRTSVNSSGVVDV